MLQKYFTDCTSQSNQNYSLMLYKDLPVIEYVLFFLKDCLVAEMEDKVLNVVSINVYVKLIF